MHNIRSSVYCEVSPHGVMDRPFLCKGARPHDDSDVGGSHSRGDRDDQDRFGKKIEMSVADRFLRVRFRVSPQDPQGVSPGNCGVGIRYGVLYIFLCFGER